MYRVKHVPSGLYWQPHKHRGSHLSKTGKVYHKEGDAKRIFGNSNSPTLRICVAKDSIVYKLTKEMIQYTDSSWASKQLYADTPVTDWIIEETK